MGLIDDIDAAATQLVADDDHTYEVAINIASAGDHWSTRSSELTDVAVLLRQTFGTYAERMHSNTGSVQTARAAHRDVATAVHQWISGGRNQPDDFAQHRYSSVRTIDTTWMDEFNESKRPLRRSRSPRRTLARWLRK